MKFCLKENKGSLSVESVIVMIYIIGVVFILVHIAHGIYQHGYMQIVSDEAVEMGQRHYLNMHKELITGSIEDPRKILDAPLYRYPYDSSQTKTEDMVEAYVSTKLKQNPSYVVFEKDMGSNISIDCNIENYIVYKKITLNITETKESTFGYWRKLFGLSENQSLSVTTQGVIQNSAEYIRTLDLSNDLILETEVGQNGMDQVNEWRDKLDECLNKWVGNSES